VFRGEPYESVSPLVKAILAVTSGGERYRLGHYGAITKVPGGNVAGKGMLLSARAASHIDEGTEGTAVSHPAFFRKHRHRGLAGRRGKGRLWRLTGHGSLLGHLGAASQARDRAVISKETPLLQCNRGRALNALGTCFLLIAASILAARKLAQFEGGTRVPATVGAISDAIRWAEEILRRIDERWPVK
jgi:hypothetical protein